MASRFLGGSSLALCDTVTGADGRLRFIVKLMTEAKSSLVMAEVTLLTMLTRSRSSDWLTDSRRALTSV